MNANGGLESEVAVMERPAHDAQAATLHGLLDDVRAAERHLARAVLTAGELASSGVSERVEGLPLDLLLSLACRLTGSDRRILITAGEALAHMPATAALFRDGALSWGQVRAITGAMRRLGAADRAELDRRIAASAAHYDGIDAYDPDQLIWAVDQAVEQFRSARAEEHAEARRRETSFISVQAALDGGVRLYAELDAVRGATVLNALDAAAARPADAARDHQEAPAEAAERWTPTPRARQYADALESVCAEWLGGGAGRPARPLLVAHVDLSQLQGRADGTVELAVRGGLPRITAATLETLAASGDVRAVLFDGAQPLATTRKVRADAIPADTRFAVRARDLGCRFPGSADPLAHTDVHHMVHREDGGDHHPQNLISLSRRFHTMSHRHGWRLKISPDTGMVTARRRQRAWRSLPRGTPLADRPEPGGDSDGSKLPF